MKTAMPKAPVASFSRTVTHHDSEHNMSHASQLRSEALAEMVSFAMRKAESLTGAVRKAWTPGVGLNSHFHRA